MASETKHGKVRRWNCLRSEIRHQGIVSWLLRLIGGQRVGW